MTPFKALYGRDPPLLLKLSEDIITVAEVDQQVCDRNIVLDLLKTNLQKDQYQMKLYVDTKRRDIEFAVGDLVYIKLHPYKFKSLAKKTNEKLCPQFYSPYKVKEKVGTVAYRLDLPSTARIHNVFHVSQLKRAVQGDRPSQQILEFLTEDAELLFGVDQGYNTSGR